MYHDRTQVINPGVEGRSMSENTTENLPDGDRIDMLVGMVQTMSADLRDVKTRLGTLEDRFGRLENTVGERLFDTRPIWERALAEIAETRSEVAELRSEITELRSELTETRSDVAGIRSEVTEMRSELTETRSELAETRSEVSEIRSELAETRSELAETRSEVSAIRLEVSQVRAEMNDGFRKLDTKMDVLGLDVLEVRAENRLLGKRVDKLESNSS